MEPIELLYENSEYAICIKPAGVLSQNGKSGEVSMIELLEGQLGGKVYPVHRLDREAAGVMVYARTNAAAAMLSRQIQNGRLCKEYLAVVRGKPKDLQGFMEDILFHDSRRNKSYVVKRARKGTRQAKLYYRVIARREEDSLVQVRLLTGRTHQIRVQFSSRGLPLRGDRTYGGGGGGLCLWSWRIGWKGQDGKYIWFSRLPEQLGGFQTILPLEDLGIQENAVLDEKVLDK